MYHSPCVFERIPGRVWLAVAARAKFSVSSLSDRAGAAEKLTYCLSLVVMFAIVSDGTGVARPFCGPFQAKPARLCPFSKLTRDDH